MCVADKILAPKPSERSSNLKPAFVLPTSTANALTKLKTQTLEDRIITPKQSEGSSNLKPTFVLPTWTANVLTKQSSFQLTQSKTVDSSVGNGGNVEQVLDHYASLNTRLLERKGIAISPTVTQSYPVNVTSVAITTGVSVASFTNKHLIKSGTVALTTKEKDFLISANIEQVPHSETKFNRTRSNAVKVEERTKIPHTTDREQIQMGIYSLSTNTEKQNQTSIVTTRAQTMTVKSNISIKPTTVDYLLSLSSLILSASNYFPAYSVRFNSPYVNVRYMHRTKHLSL